MPTAIKAIQLIRKDYNYSLSSRQQPRMRSNIITHRLQMDEALRPGRASVS